MEDLNCAEGLQVGASLWGESFDWLLCAPQMNLRSGVVCIVGARLWDAGVDGCQTYAIGVAPTYTGAVQKRGLALQKRRHRKIYAAKALMYGWANTLKPDVGSHRYRRIAHRRILVCRYVRGHDCRAVVDATTTRKIQFGMDVFTGIPCHIRAACKRQRHTMRSKRRPRHDVARGATLIGVHGDPGYDGLTAMRCRNLQQIADGEVCCAAIRGRLLQKLNADEVVSHINIPSRRRSGRAKERPAAGYSIPVVTSAGCLGPRPNWVCTVVFKSDAL